MKKIEKVTYKCDYCNREHESEEFMKFHEECCALNPKNQPCAVCENMILGLGCLKKVPIESVGENVLCFYYKEGIPRNPLNQLFKLDGNGEDNDDTDS